MKLTTISGILFLWAVFGTLSWTVSAGLLGGYRAMVSNVVHSWCQRWPFLRVLGIAFFLWVAFHLFVEDICRKETPDRQVFSSTDQTGE